MSQFMSMQKGKLFFNHVYYIRATYAVATVCSLQLSFPITPTRNMGLMFSAWHNTSMEFISM
jgi:hypothetical protein